MRVMGLDDFLEQLREAMRERYRQFNLDRALDEIAEQLEELLDLERDTLDAAAATRPAQRQARRSSTSLPRRLSEAIEQLRDYEFEDDDARAEFEHLLEELDNIRELEEFQRRYGELFQGPQALDYEQALELMREMERLKQLEDDLLAGRPRDAQPRGSARAARRRRRRRTSRTCASSCCCCSRPATSAPAAGASQLSPKGMRKIGQLALRDIYQGLLRDRAGGHQADHRGLAEVRPEETQARTRTATRCTSTSSARCKQRAGARAAARRCACGRTTSRSTRPRTRPPRSTVLLLDMSWSMSWEGRFAAAKKVALAMESLIRSRYPRDYFAIVGFYTRAIELKLRDLPEASWNMGDPFTNLQDGLRLASELLSTPSEHQPAHDRHHRRPADGVLLARPPLLRVAAVVRRHQHARRAGDAEGGRARHPHAASPSTPSCSTTARACAPSSSA